MKKGHIFSIFLGFIGIFAASFIISFIIFSEMGVGSTVYDSPQTAAEPSKVPVQAKEIITEPKVNNRTVIQEEIFYKSCRHIITENISNNQHYIGFGKDDFAEQGWQVLEYSNGTVKLSRIAEGFCPDDQLKYHINCDGETVTLYRGPLGCNGEPLGQYAVPLDMLPADIKTKLIQEGFEFANETELLEMLDSIDEIIPHEYTLQI